MGSSRSAWQEQVAAQAALKALAHEVIAASRNHRHLAVLRRALQKTLGVLNARKAAA